MAYELECGHCGCVFTPEDGLRAKSVKCPVCGGTLTVAVPVPKTPEPSEIPSPIPKLRFPPISPEPGDLAPARKLAEPWPIVRGWLNMTRAVSEFVRPFFGLVLGFGLLSIPFQPAARQGDAAEHLLAMLGAVFFIPAVLHAICQIVCLDVPKGYGAWLVVASVAALGLAVCALVGTVGAKGFLSAIAGVVCVALVLLSFGLWLLFLSHIGTRLGDDELTTAVSAYGPQLSGGFAVAFPLLCGTYLAGQAGAWFFVWCGFAGSGAIGFRLLRRYSAVLNTAVAALDRRAPAAP